MTTSPPIAGAAPRGPDHATTAQRDAFWHRLHRLPKTDLHIHLDGSIRPATLIELSDARGRSLPTHDADALGRYMHVTDARDLVDYLARFEITLSALQTADALERVAFELVEDAAAENVRYTDSVFRVMLNGRLYDTSLAEVVASLDGDAPDRFARAFVWSAELGVPLSDSLRALADDVRDAVSLRFAEDVRRASMRVLVPLGVLVLPAFVLACLVPLFLGGLQGLAG